MKHSKALLEVWEWKDKVYRETKDMPTDEWLRYVHKNYEKMKKKYGLRLRTRKADSS